MVKPLEGAKRVAVLGPGERRGDGPLADTLWDEYHEHVSVSWSLTSP